MIVWQAHALPSNASPPPFPSRRAGLEPHRRGRLRMGGSICACDQLTASKQPKGHTSGLLLGLGQTSAPLCRNPRASMKIERVTPQGTLLVWPGAGIHCRDGEGQGGEVTSKTALPPENTPDDASERTRAHSHVPA